MTNQLRPKKFEKAKICENCRIEFMPDPEDREFCKGCDPQNTGVPIIQKKVSIDEDLVHENRTQKLEKQIVELDKRVKKLEDIFDAIKLPKEEIKEETKEEVKVETKGHYPKVCPECGEPFIAKWPAEKTCDSCKEKDN